MSPEYLAQITVNSLMLSLSYILFALGFTYIFSILRVITFAHGEIYMLGAYATWVGVTFIGLNYFFSLFTAILVVFAFGLVLFMYFWRPILDNPMACLVLSIGFLLVLQGVITIFFGERNLSLPPQLPGVIEIFGAVLVRERALIMVISLILFLAVHFFLKDHKIGQAMRAVTSDPEVAALQGIKVQQIQMYGFGIACALAAAAGGLMANIYAITPTMGLDPLFKSLVIVILGGLGSIPGVVIAGFIIGFIDSFGLTLIGRWAALVSFSFVIIILLIRPKGLMGHED